MPTEIGPMRIARHRRDSVTNVSEEGTIDFRLALNQGILLHAVEFGMREAVLTPVDDSVDSEQVHLSLHQEEGALEGAIDAFPADQTILNSEIIAETTLFLYGFTSSVPATSPDTFSMIWLQPLSWNYHQLLGGPLVLAQNLTFRAISSAAVMVAGGCQVTLFYQYANLTTKELAAQFILRR